MPKGKNTSSAASLKLPKPATGPLQSLISRIEHLLHLLQGLPHHDSVPLDPIQSTYNFSLNPDILEDGGPFAAISQCLEVNFATWRNPDGLIHFAERGKQLERMITMLKQAVKMMSEKDREAFSSAWLERLITAAINQGAKASNRPSQSALPAKRKANEDASGSNSPTTSTTVDRLSIPGTDIHERSRPRKRFKQSNASHNRSEVINIDLLSDAESESPAEMSPSLSTEASSKQVTLNALGWKAWESEEAKRNFFRAEMEEGAENRRLEAEKQRLRDQRKLDRKREQGAKRARKHRANLKWRAEEGEDKNDAITTLMRGVEAQASQSQLPGDASAAVISRPVMSLQALYAQNSRILPPN
ncbi:hypothetical protein ARMGADRAFT_1085498 [Armillaria gallica]|uniref:Uncharacterized protein n=1 Tax=Armillaria gallica TaxID=47427 RepID=A0A2H3CWS4_ARMGA|nr:hypothetical protein ARMGADRAFT_1085498 [Armillaria gallica]